MWHTPSSSRHAAAGTLNSSPVGTLSRDQNLGRVPDSAPDGVQGGVQGGVLSEAAFVGKNQGPVFSLRFFKFG